MAGVYPIVNTTASNYLPAANAITYKQQALSVLEKNCVFHNLGKQDSVGMKMGRTVPWYRPINFDDPTALTPSAGDSIGTQLTYKNRTIRVTMLNYTDFVVLNRQLVETSPMPDLDDAAARLGYRLSLLHDNIARQALDAEAAGMNQALLGDYPTGRDMRNLRTQLVNNNVEYHPSYGNAFPLVACPLNTYDIYNDPNGSGIADVVKYGESTADMALQKYPKRGTAFRAFANVAIIESTNVKSYTSGGNTYYRMYGIGDECFGVVGLAGKGGKGNLNRMEIVAKKTEQDGYDPAGELGAFASFNSWGASTILDGNSIIGGVYRGRTLDAQSAAVS
jgi:N4-gp56 family major capsid protein